MCCIAFASGTASAAPVTLPLQYVHVDGSSDISISGSVTYDGSIQTPNQDIFDLTTGLIAVSITVQGPGVPGGSTTFTLADSMTWVFRTNSQRRIIDLNFLSDANGVDCFVYGVDAFLLGFYCGEPEDEGDFVTLKGLVLPKPSAQPVPTLDPVALMLLSLLLAATTAIPALRRRR